MNKIPYIHYSKDTTSLIKHYFLALIPLIIFSIYKNGFLLYNNNLITFKTLLLPFYFLIISLVVASLVSFIFKEKIGPELLIALIISLTISPNTNYIIYPILLFIMFVILKVIKLKTKKEFNMEALIRLFLILSLLFNSYSYLNIAEKLHKFNYSYFDVFLGFTSGGLGTTSLFLLIISFIILALNKFYKKIIPFMASLGYLIPLIIYFFISKEPTTFLAILNGHNYYSFIFLASLVATPNSSKSMSIYGLLIGIITSLITIFFNFYEASYISIFLVSLTIPFFNKLENKKY